MLKKLGLLLGVAACGALVTSCGGDDTPTPTPTPTGTDTATPTPTPTSGTLAFNYAADFETTSRNTTLIVSYFTPEGGAETFNGATRVNGNSSIDYDASPNTVLIAYPELAPNPSFAEADLVSADAMRRTYEKGETALVLDLPFTYVLRAMYEVDNQPFTREAVTGTLRTQRYSSFFLVSTASSDITSALTYTGDVLVVGGTPGTTAPNALSAATTTFTITPGTNDVVSGTITISETSGGTTTTVASFSFSGNLDANNGFSGEISDTARGLTGTLAGALAGPARDEMFIVFSLSNSTDGRVYIGNFIGN